jgi:hypothetical protein
LRAATSTYYEPQEGTLLVLRELNVKLALNVHVDLGEAFVLSTGNTKERSDPTMPDLILYETLNK